MKITLGKSVFDVDVDETRRSYTHILAPGPERCGCSYCRNWIAQRQIAYPQSVVKLLADTGIRFGFETEVWDAPWDNGRRYYGGWYPFVGNIRDFSDIHTAFDAMEVWVSKGLTYKVPWQTSDTVHEIHFSAVVDWVLDEPNGTEQTAAAAPPLGR